MTFLSARRRFASYEEALVRSCYRILLGREPDASVTRVQRAAPIKADEEQRFREILLGVIQSDEFNARYAGLVSKPLMPVGDLVRGSRVEVEDRIRALCQATYLGDGVALCRALGRFHMFVHTSDVGFATHVMHSGIWEMPLTEFMVRTIKPKMRVLDIGANYGYYSLLMADLVQGDGLCQTFEPNPKVAQLLKRSLSVNGFESRSRVWEIALSNSNEDSVNFFVPHNEPKNGHLVADVDDARLNDGYFTKVAMRSPNSLASELGRIDFMKIDAEGAEIHIIDSMRDILREQRPVMVVEVNCARYDAVPMLQSLSDIYGSVNFIGHDGYSHPTSIEEVTTLNFGFDWLIHFDPQVSAAAR